MRSEFDDIVRKLNVIAVVLVCLHVEPEQITGNLELVEGVLTGLIHKVFLSLVGQVILLLGEVEHACQF